MRIFIIFTLHNALLRLSKRMRWAGHVARIGKGVSWGGGGNIITRKAWREETTRRPRKEDNTEMNIKEIWRDTVEWIYLIMRLRVP